MWSSSRHTVSSHTPLAPPNPGGVSSPGWPRATRGPTDNPRERPYNPGMCEHATPLPDGLDLCHEIIRQRADTIGELQRRVEQLEHQVELLLRRQFGPRRESVDPDQLRLFSDDVPDDIAEGTTEQPAEEAKPKRRWRRAWAAEAS